MGHSFRKSDSDHLVYRPQDPRQYGFICGGCNARYGKQRPGGYIDIARCSNCPSLERSEAEFYKNKRLKEMGRLCSKL